MTRVLVVVCVGAGELMENPCLEVHGDGIHKCSGVVVTASAGYQQRSARTGA